MTEEEKRKLALSIMEQERQRLAQSSFRDHQTVNAAHAQRRIDANQQLLASLAQNGITWAQLDAAYNEAFARGESDMLTYHFSFFYAATAIAYHEAFSSSPDATAAFIRALLVAPEEASNHQELVEKAKRETDVDTSYADVPSAKARKTTHKDRQDVERMTRTGITERDLQANREAGYAAGRNSRFFLSACFATVALTLHQMHEWGSVRIEQFLDRIQETMDDEISTADIIERAKEEAGVDVSDIATTTEDNLPEVVVGPQ
ncbi:MAG: hypothetical protein E7337_11950 [Clostridiales bacterium]|nr:hypothetical protein [Clostridiales bacterium]